MPPSGREFSARTGRFSPGRSKAGDRREQGPPPTGAKSAPRSGDAEGATRKTLDRVLSRAGVGSRTVAAEWIREGRVRVNGRVVRDPDVWVDPENDRVLLDGRVLRPRDRLYVLLYKPRGYLCTREDPEKRPTIYDLVADVKSWVFNVGRLDLDTSGLLILTNDTDLGELLTNPAYKVSKTYLVKSSTRLDDEQIQRLRDGVTLSDGVTQPAEVVRLRDSEKYTHLAITIREGRNRQVRRMLEAVDSKVLKLVRTHIGPISIGKLQIGQHRPLSAEEVKTLKDLAEAAAGTGGVAGGSSSSKTSAAKQRMHQIREESSERWSSHEDD
ncbi:MAG: rRNA pseudouridine synthase [Bryobacterales bacterium]|nr:rRNA pseudouridine synthase [Bryobacterales bacterium]